MADNSKTQGNAKTGGLTIPQSTRAQFSDLIEMIVKSQSMDLEERQYWINALPVMTKEQVTSLRDILEKEKKQLADEEKKHGEAVSKIDKKYRLQFDSFAYTEKKRVLKEKEKTHRAKEEEGLSGILDEIENIEKKT